MAQRQLLGGNGTIPRSYELPKPIDGDNHELISIGRHSPDLSVAAAAGLPAIRTSSQHDLQQLEDRLEELKLDASPLTENPWGSLDEPLKTPERLCGVKNIVWRNTDLITNGIRPQDYLAAPSAGSNAAIANAPPVEALNNSSTRQSTHAELLNNNPASPPSIAVTLEQVQNMIVIALQHFSMRKSYSSSNGSSANGRRRAAGTRVILDLK